MLSLRNLVLTLTLVLVAGSAFTFYTHLSGGRVVHHSVISEEDTIRDGQGWKHVVLGATKDAILNYLGKPDKVENFNDVYFYDYYSNGIQINFSNSSNTVSSIFFYHNQTGSKEFTPFDKKTERNIGFDNTVDDVIRKYGKPQKDYSGVSDGINWQRIVYSNIDFRFEGSKMVRISVF